MSFTKKGYRASTQKHLKFNMNGVKRILSHLDMVYDVMSQSDKFEVTEDNLLELAEPLMGRPLDHIEANILKGKFNFNSTEDVREDNHTEHS